MADKKVKSKAELQKEANAIEIKENGFLNPFSVGVTYEAFLADKKDKSVKDYCKNKLTKSQIEWLENDIKSIKK